MVLRVSGTTPSSVFGTFGAKENTATFALGWVLEQSSALRRSLMPLLGLQATSGSKLAIDLQRHAQDGGYTDIEIYAANRFHVIIEAKRGWTLPGQEQLVRYVDRLRHGGAPQKKLVSVSAATAAYAGRLPKQIAGVDVIHVPWSEVQRAARAAHARTTSVHEKLWLRQLDSHLEAYVTVQDPSDNNVYVVSLGNGPILEGRPYTWTDVVETDRRYFHPVGGSGWPVIPPNYLGFRYQGQLQSVHHVAGFDVVQDLSQLDDRWPVTDGDHFIYRLGPAMRPGSTVRTGKIFRNGRVWCAIDTLLSGEFATISEARDETKRRLNRAEEIP